MSRDNVNREGKAKIDTVSWDSLITDAEEQIKQAEQRIEKLTDSIQFFKQQIGQKAATRN